MKRGLEEEDTDDVRSKRQDMDEEIIDNDTIVELGDESNPLHAATSGQGHPVGVQPEGNLLQSDKSNCRNSGLMSLSVFDDTFICENILSLLDGRDLMRLACVSRAFYAFIFSSDNEIWRPLVLDLTAGDFTYQWNWRKTYEVEFQRRHTVLYPSVKDVNLMNSFATYPNADFKRVFTQQESRPPFKLDNFFSDVLFEGWYCLDAFKSNQDVWDKEYNIDRIDAAKVTVEEFLEKYEKPGKPCVITNYAPHWRAKETWTVDNLETSPDYCDTRFACGMVDIPLDKFLLYCRRVTTDESPLYLFDKQFVERCPAIAKDYSVPPYFEEDFFSYLTEHNRPPYRWWLIGAVASGSSFHKDPLYTHAFNGLISGKKKWIMYPKHIVPPGVYASQDHLEVYSPISVCEWFVKYYHETQLLPRKQKNVPSTSGGEYDDICDSPAQCATYSQYKPVEIIQKPGEIVYVPSQWWHTAVNLDAEKPQGTGSEPQFNGAIAVTSNNIHKGNYLHCLQFLSKIGQEAMRADLEKGVEGKYPGLKKQQEQEKKTNVENRVKAHSNNSALAQQVGDNAVQQSAVSAVKEGMNLCFQKEEVTQGFSFGFDFAE